MIGRTLSHYRIVERLGAGGMGVVYRAEDESLDRRNVAIKVLRPEFVAERHNRARFLIEAKAVALLEHPNLCEVYEVGEADEDTLFIVMAYYGGGSLRRCIPPGGLEPADAFSIAYSAAQGLRHAHRCGIVHRDIKPGNLMFTRDGYLKIVDFGLAKLAAETRITATGATLGTVAYMSPQQAAGEPVDQRTDVWSLGVVLYEMLTGKLPFRGDAQQVLLYSIRNDEPVPLGETSPDLDDGCVTVVHRCLQKDLASRYGSADELIHDIRALSRAKGWDHGGRSVDPVPVPPTPDLSTLPAGSTVAMRRTGARLRTALTVVLAAAAAVVVWLATRDSPPPSPFVTEVRAAVLPLASHTGPDEEPLAAGLSALVTELVEEASRHHESMWVALAGHVTYAGLSSADDAREALGVNRVITGDVQRFRDHRLLTLRLLDADAAAVVDSVLVEFDPDEPTALIEELPLRVLDLLDVDRGRGDDLSATLPAVPAAVVPYLTGWGTLGSDADRAVADLTRALELDPGFRRGRARLAQALLSRPRDTGDTGSVERTFDLLRPAFDAGRGTPLENELLGDAFRARGDPDSAVAAYTRALVGDPARSLSANRAARILRQQGRYGEAVALLRGVIAAEPDYFGHHRLLGAHYYGSDQPAEATEEFRRSLELAPKDAFSINALGAIHFSAGDWPAARSMFERSFELVPTCDACSNVGLMYYYEENFEASAQYYEYAKAYCDTTDHELWANLARSWYWVPGERERAISIFRKCIDLAEAGVEEGREDVETIVHLADFHAMVGDDRRARDLLARAEPRLGNDGDLLYRVGSTWEVLGERNQALRYVSDAVRGGYPLSFIRGDPELRDLVADVRFKSLVEAAADSLVD